MDKSVYKRQFEENKNHWWFESRKKIVQNILEKNIKKKKNQNFRFWMWCRNKFRNVIKVWRFNCL